MSGVLYDGWSLVYQPESPAALHLLALLDAHPAGFRAALALPGISFHPLPEAVQPLVTSTPDTAQGRLRWEQRLLPGLARQSQAGLLHCIGSSAPLVSGPPVLISPAEFSATTSAAPFPRPGVAARLRDALAQGGLARARALLWPGDLPAPQLDLPLCELAPGVHPLFDAAGGKGTGSPAAAAELDALHLPETFVLYHGPAGEYALRSLLAAWSWAAPTIGNDYPLLLVGLGEAAQRRLESLAGEYGLADTFHCLPRLSLPALAALYQACSAVFHPVEPSPWGDAARLALAAARPLVGIETALSSALVGPAAYLVPFRSFPLDAAAHRALGAALLTVIVEESVAQALSDAAAHRAASWAMLDFKGQLEETYRRFAR
jgi:hypothetical protein